MTPTRTGSVRKLFNRLRRKSSLHWSYRIGLRLTGQDVWRGEFFKKVVDQGHLREDFEEECRSSPNNKREGFLNIG